MLEKFITNDIVVEGMNMNTAKMIRDEDIQEFAMEGIFKRLKEAKIKADAEIDKYPLKELLSAGIRSLKNNKIPLLTGSSAKAIQQDIMEETKNMSNKNALRNEETFDNDPMRIVLKPFDIEGVPIIATFGSSSISTKSFIDFMYWKEDVSKFGPSKGKNKGGYLTKQQCYSALMAEQRSEAKESYIDNFIIACESYMINDDEFAMEGISDIKDKIGKYEKAYRNMLNKDPQKVAQYCVKYIKLKNIKTMPNSEAKTLLNETYAKNKEASIAGGEKVKFTTIDGIYVGIITGYSSFISIMYGGYDKNGNPRVQQINALKVKHMIKNDLKAADKANVNESYIDYTDEEEEALESVLVEALEAKLTKAERDKLPDELFGLPKQRKFPLNDEHHVFQAIKFFHFCKGKDRKELANNIVKRMRELNISIKFDEKSLITKYADLD